MSLINQMLRDLDARRGPASSVESAALQGMGLASSAPRAQHVVLYRIGWGVGLILAGLLIQQGYQARIQTQARQETAPTDVAVKVTSPQTAAIATVQPVTPAAPVKEEPAPANPEKADINTTPSMASPGKPAPVVHTRKTETPVRKIIKSLTPEQKALRRFNHAQTLLARNNPRAATNELHSALDLDPALVDARIQLASLYLGKGHVDTARQLLETGHQLKPFHTRMTAAYARLLASQGEFAAALGLLHALQQQGTSDAETIALSASLYYQLNQHENAASHYRMALSLKPEQGIWWMGLGVSLENTSRSGDALEAYRRARMTLGDEALLTFVTGRITALSGQME